MSDDLDFGPTIRGLQPGTTVFNRYRLERMLGRGGMGVVWLAEDRDLDLRVALKFLPESVVGDTEAVADLKRETRRSLQLTHANIVRIYDFMTDGHAAAISMEYVEGKTLTELKLEQPERCFAPEALMPWLEQLVGALRYAHEKVGIVHRDLKPANLMITKDGDLKVADFGISSHLSDSHSRLSGAAGRAAGTLVYMSPQQFQGKSAAVTDDVYSLGATLYELLAGKPPFFRGSIEHQLQYETPVSLAERRKELGVVAAAPLSALWEEVVAACLEKEPDKRPQSVKEVWRRLTEVQRPAAPPSWTVPPPLPEVLRPAPPMMIPLPGPGGAYPTAAPPAGKPAMPTPTPPHETRTGSKRKAPLVAVAAIAAVAIGGGIWWKVAHREEPSKRLAAATKDAPFENSLGMKFVPVPINGGPTEGQKVYFCIHETRSRDYAAFMADPKRGYTMSGSDADNWKTYEYEWVPVGRGVGEGAEQSEHPVANVSWLDAVAFCEWLSKKEGLTYRLPTDREWSVAMGIPQEPAGPPKELSLKLEDEYPWGGRFEPSAISGNYADTAAKAKFSDLGSIDGYRDGYATTSPVMQFKANRFGLYDMGGNLWEWCAGCYDGKDEIGADKTLTNARVLRGGSWGGCDRVILASSYRGYFTPDYRGSNGGFRCVVVRRSSP